MEVVGNCLGWCRGKVRKDIWREMWVVGMSKMVTIQVKDAEDAMSEEQHICLLLYLECIDWLVVC